MVSKPVVVSLVETVMGTDATMEAVVVSVGTVVAVAGAEVLVETAAVSPHSSTLAWKIPWTEEPGRLQSMGSLGIRYD